MHVNKNMTCQSTQTQSLHNLINTQLEMTFKTKAVQQFYNFIIEYIL